eukprot:4959810-Amphidinium_carterae.1
MSSCESAPSLRRWDAWVDYCSLGNQWGAHQFCLSVAGHVLQEATLASHSALGFPQYYGGGDRYAIIAVLWYTWIIGASFFAMTQWWRRSLSHHGCAVASEPQVVPLTMVAEIVGLIATCLSCFTHIDAFTPCLRRMLLLLMDVYLANAGLQPCPGSKHQAANACSVPQISMH